MLARNEETKNPSTTTSKVNFSENTNQMKVKNRIYIMFNFISPFVGIAYR